jgi:ribosomal protein S18 acetylase RimI-like enzyme
MDRFETAAARPEPSVTLPEDVEIRPARARDAAPFVEMWRSVVEEGRWVRSETVAHPTRVYRARFRRPWTDEEAQIVAVEGERVVGHLYIQRERHPVTRHVATLGIAVAPDRRGEGIGAALLDEAIRWARGAGVEKIVLSVYPSNTAAISLYRRFGFVDEGRLSRQSRRSGGYLDEILMGLWLGG